MKNTHLLDFGEIQRTGETFPKMKSIFEGNIRPKNKLETRFWYGSF